MSDQENNQDNNNIKYSSYTEAQKRATQKYRSNNKDKVNEQRKKYYQQRKENDPEFLEYKRAKAREYYQRKKQPPVPDSQQSNQQQLNDDMEGLEQLQLSALPAPPQVEQEQEQQVEQQHEPQVEPEQQTVDPEYIEVVEVPVVKKTRKPRRKANAEPVSI
jgi:hypothetical protein